MVSRVGVLALQGAARPHLELLASLGVDATTVRAPGELERVTHLVLPGGESTTQRRLLVRFELWELLRERHRAGELALFGTCAGAILLARGGAPGERLGLLDAEVERNAYGRQRASDEREVDALGEVRRVPFIRAPRIRAVGAGARVLARIGDEPVAVEAPGLLACTFHPELVGDGRFHRRFLGSSPRSGSGAPAYTRGVVPSHPSPGDEP